jgi:Cytochrome P450
MATTPTSFTTSRFLRQYGKRLDSAGFRCFGGGSTLCPGRHFASPEIIAFVALNFPRFDIKSVGSKWGQPTTDKAGMQATVPPPPPDPDVEVEITVPGGELAGKQFNAILTGSDQAGKAFS